MDKISLRNDMKSEDFKDYYWTKKELNDFCRLNGIDSSGLKFDVEKRIIKFLETGVREKKSPKLKGKKEFILNLETIVDDSFKRSKVNTAFIKEHCPDFHYTYWMNRYIEENLGKIKLKDLIIFWEKEKIKKKNKTVKKIPQDEYNAFIVDFFKLTKKKYTMNDAIKCWNIKKELKKNMFSNTKTEIEYIVREAKLKTNK